LLTAALLMTWFAAALVRTLPSARLEAKVGWAKS
jgi:hypothetical protein